MAMMTTVRTPPQDAPRCWGRSFQPNDRECGTCAYQYSCKEAFSSSNGIPIVPQNTSGAIMPVIPQAPIYPVPFAVPTAAPPAQWRTVQTSPQAMQPPQHQSQLPSAAQFPGIPPYFYAAHAVGPYDYQAIIGLQPGESTGERIAKNVVLRIGEALLTEILRFVHFFSWPKNPA